MKGAHERFARLGVIAQILRNPESRERYVESFSAQILCSKICKDTISSIRTVYPNGEGLDIITLASDQALG